MAEVKEHNQTNTSRDNPLKSMKACEYMTYSEREAFKRMRTNVLISLGDHSPKGNSIIGVTSAQPSEGKSTISINLAYSLAELGKSVILIDCDLRRPTIHTKMGIQQTIGITEVISGNENLSKTPIRYKSSANNVFFDVIVAGQSVEKPSELLSSQNFQQVLETVGNLYDVVILDLPPVNVVIDAAVVAQLTDGLVLVIRENHCPRFVLKDCMEQLQYVKANILGFVMNGSVNGAGKRYQYGKAYRYGNAYYNAYYDTYYGHRK